MPDVGLVSAPSDTILLRIASLRGDGPLRWPSLDYLRTRGGGIGRFDDPRSADSEYTVLYAATERRTCFVETLDQFRVDAGFIARVAREIPSDNADAIDVLEARLTVEIPETYFAKRIGRFRIEEAPPFLDVRLTATQTSLTLSRAPEIARVLTDIGYRRVTPGDLVGNVRVLTQAVSQWAFRRGLGGIVYNSCHELRDAVCWALFPHREVRISSAGPLAEIERDDPPLLAVARQFNLIVPGDDGK
jgi:hypothetical protein